MIAAAKPTTGSAELQSDLWGEHAHDWAEVMEGWSGWGIPIYRHVLERLTVGRETNLLDVGCGAGRFCRIAADRGAACAGIDATGAFVEIARDRIPGGDFRVGEMEKLPWADDSFDVVTGFNSFFIAANMINALREAHRVARPGAKVAMTVFGRPERCQSTDLFAAIRQLVPQNRGSASDDSAPLHAEGTLESAAREAGLVPDEGGYFAFTEQYPNLETMLRGYMAALPFVRAARAVGVEPVRLALTEALESLRTPEGRYQLRDEIRYLVATA